MPELASEAVRPHERFAHALVRRKRSGGWVVGEGRVWPPPAAADFLPHAVNLLAQTSRYTPNHVATHKASMIEKKISGSCHSRWRAQIRSAVSEDRPHRACSPFTLPLDREQEGDAASDERGLDERPALLARASPAGSYPR